MTSPAPHPFDYVLVGGGLQNGLVALALRSARPAASIVMVERANLLGGNHTWCFHDGDVPPEALAWLSELVAQEWPRYDVRFPGFERTVDIGYRAITSDRFDAVVKEAVRRGPGELLTGVDAVEVSPGRVRLSDGRVLRARLVVDARGPGLQPAPERARAGWQKFVGLEVRTRRPHGLGRPLLMDALGPQHDGFRFMYVLPFGPDRALVEDTRFSDDAALDVAQARTAVESWMNEAGWDVDSVERVEAGVLPMPWGPLEPSEDLPGLLHGGMRGGWFHPGTGYSLAPAARLAHWLAQRSPEEATGPALAAFRADHLRRARFARRMNWALFRLADPDQRIHMLMRFYRRPEAVIRRYYGLALTAADQWRVLAGAPPKGMRWRPRPLLEPPTEAHR
ncbi:MAG: hypothetical protein RL199_1885 [Pseudomonadota bacterium]|jgi:lycopene beta-cyclase